MQNVQIYLFQAKLKKTKWTSFYGCLINKIAFEN